MEVDDCPAGAGTRESGHAGASDQYRAGQQPDTIRVSVSGLMMCPAGSGTAWTSCVPASARSSSTVHAKGATLSLQQALDLASRTQDCNDPAGES
jgi:hypothetical protein